MIKFQCPTGHPLTATEDLAGKSGKCPKCDARFVIPQPGNGAAGGGSDTASGLMRTPVTPTSPSGINKAAAGEVFVFLCPNGHKLNGPPSLKGKAGQCPHCGARFRIPTDEEIQESEQEYVEQEQENFSPDQEGTVGPEGFDHFAGPEGPPDVISIPPPGASGLGFIVGQLWRRRTQDTELEIFLSEGEIVAPDFFSELLSTSDYGVFAIQEGDGSFAVSIIPWSAVRRVGLRRLGELPAELFE
jgi:hypothetical protein